MAKSETEYIQQIERELTYHAQLKSMLEEVTDELTSATGQDYFDALMCSIGDVLHVDYVLITHHLEGWVVEPIAAYAHGNLMNCPAVLNVDERPCRTVLEQCEAVKIASSAQAPFVGGTSNAYVGVPLRDSGGDTIGHLAVGSDSQLDASTPYLLVLEFLAVQAAAELEHMRLEKEILSSLNNFQLMFETSPLGMAINNAQGALIDVNPAFCDILHYSREELRTMNITDIVHPLDLDTVLLFHDDLVAGKYVHFHVEKRFLGKKNQLIWCEATTFAIRDKNNQYLQTVSFIENVTEHRRAYALLEERVEKRTYEIEQRRRIAESLRDILETINQEHDLQNILTKIVEKAHMLLGSDACVLHRLVGDDTAPTVVVSSGHDAQSPLPGQSVIRQTITEQSTNVVPNLAEENLGYQCMLAFPLVLAREVYGCLALYYIADQSFTKEAVMLAESFANQASLALENAHLREKARQMAALEERNRLARELHDAVSQTLWSASLLGEVLPSVWERDPDLGLKQLEQMNQLSRVALAEMRALLLELRPDTLTSTSLKQLLSNLSESISYHSQLPVQLEADDQIMLPNDVQISFYRIAQEALNNVVKHAQAKRVVINLQQSKETVEMRVADDGLGIVQPRDNDSSLGLKIMKERATAIEAELELLDNDPHGTIVKVRWEKPETIR